MTTADIQSQDHRDLLDIIDRLRSQGFSRYVDLPEIIVCGDQSAGKSSVLEAISGMSFPAKDGLCTRFATELVLRRDPTTSIKVSITPGEESYSEGEKKALQKWRPQVDIDEDGGGLEAVVEDAKKAMRLSPTKNFCKDTLRVELSGPTQPHLTMVDLPGIYRTSNKEQSADDVNLVQDMIRKYMKRPRSIILAVVSASSDYVLQDVMKFAREADPDGRRTMGLITKPDKLDSGSDSESKWVSLAQNTDVELDLGWHVLRNRKYEERDCTLSERNATEAKFFSQGVWDAVSPAHCGVKSLKGRLSSVLLKQILLQLPNLMIDVERGVSDCDSRLERLGPARGSPMQQRRYLSRVSEDFSSLIKDAVEGRYNHAFFGNTKMVEGYEKRLRAVVQNRLTDFAEQMREEGQSLAISDSDSESEYFGSHQIARSAYIDDVKRHMKRSKGCELPGLFNPLIVGELFVEQCQPWRRIAKRTTQSILNDVYETTRAIIEYTAANEVAREVLEHINTGIERLKMSLDDKLEELLKLHEVIHPITYNRDLTENVQKSQRARNKRAVKAKIQQTFGSKPFDDPDSKIYVNPARLVDLFLDELEVDMDRFGSTSAVDYMQAYYKVALDRFIDDVGNHAIEDRLIRQLPSLFTARTVLELEDDDICRLGRESDEAATERARDVRR
ncbi:hypothetical protein ACHAQA_009893 [Verticillium albo-atrum]